MSGPYENWDMSKKLLPRKPSVLLRLLSTIKQTEYRVYFTWTWTHEESYPFETKEEAEQAANEILNKVGWDGELVWDFFRVPDRGSGNPTPLGGLDCSASHVNWLDGSVQTRQPYRLGLPLSEFGILRKRYWGQHLWGRGYWSTLRTRRRPNRKTTSM
jgi:hypothetical protein